MYAVHIIVVFYKYTLNSFGERRSLPMFVKVMSIVFFGCRSIDPFALLAADCQVPEAYPGRSAARHASASSFRQSPTAWFCGGHSSYWSDFKGLSNPYSSPRLWSFINEELLDLSERIYLKPYMPSRIVSCKPCCLPCSSQISEYLFIHQPQALSDYQLPWWLAQSGQLDKDQVRGI